VERVPPCDTYFPKVASLFAFALTSKASWAAFLFSSFPAHVFTHVFCKALPYENVKPHGFLSALFISLRLTEASSSLYPPLKNVIPGNAAGIVLSNVLTVNAAILSLLISALLGKSSPGVIMLGFNNAPSQYKC